MLQELIKKEEPVNDHFLIVGVGASAGGLQALKQFVHSIPDDSGMAYVLVQHLDPNFLSILPELLQQVTAIPVNEITNDIALAPDNIFVVPPNKTVGVRQGALTLTDSSSRRINELPIDSFMHSLAETYQTQALGVILSGTGKDGSSGLRAIKLGGGTTFAQHHSSAEYNEMPQNAINAKVVDFVLPPEGIVHQLLELNRVFTSSTTKPINRDSPEDVCFKKILNAIDLHKGIDFTYYKQSTLRRRISRRVILRNFARVEDYLADLTTNPAEVESLYRDLLIPVTEFFRDSPGFDYLSTIALPTIVQSINNKELFRAWCVGCSTGQEAYSIAICLFEHFAKQSGPVKLQVFATDISETGIAHARSGFYSNDEVANVSPERLEKFFVKAEGGFYVNKLIRDICVFASHNVLTSPPFAGINLISCRNVLIYMEPFLQRKAMATFHYSLNEKGMLFLGKSESIGSSSDLFTAFSDKDKFYSRNSVTGRFTHISTKRRAELFGKSILPKPKESKPNDDYQKSADDLVLLRAPAGVVVNDHFEILQYRGATGEWLEAPSGKPSVNVLKMCRHGLSIDVRSALQKAKMSNLPVVKQGIVVTTGDARKVVTIEVIPILNTINLYFLVQFINTLTFPLPDKRTNGKSKAKASGEYLRSQELERELSQTREDMRAITEDQEVGNEELLSANEELLSGSEELRSLNEELEISKEELQSTVEELSVSNQELSFRNDELTYARKYSEAIITTISEPLLVLNKALQIKSANEAFFNFFKLSEKEGIGKYFFELDNCQWDLPELKEIIDLSLADGRQNRVFELKKDFMRIGEHTILIHCRKLVRESTSEPLLLLIVENITARKLHEELIQSQAEYSRNVLDSNPIITTTASPDGLVTYSNKHFLKYSGLTQEDAVSLGWEAVIHPDERASVRGTWLDAVSEGAGFTIEVRLRRHDGVYRWHASHALPLRNSDGIITSWVCSCTDIHDGKMFAEELERQIADRTQALTDSNNELEHSNKNLEQFAFIASHDLQEPLRKIQTFSSILVNNYTEGVTPEVQKLIQKIQASSKRLSILIGDVLSFSRIQSSESAFQTTDLNAILANVLDDFSLLIEEKQATINCGNLPIMEAVPIQLNQLFYNLLSNSLKFSKASEAPLITITSRNLTKVELAKFSTLNPSLDYCEIIFADNGIGFDPRFKEQIFHIFQRLHHHDQYPGTGIGLALCRRIVAKHHGLLHADSQPNTGSLFRIVLPLNEHHAAVELLPGYVE